MTEFYQGKGMTKRAFSHNLEFIVASLTYILAHVIDYLFTVPGIKAAVTVEGNPVIQGYIDIFGVENGVMFSKLFICAGVIFGAKAISLAYKNRKTKIKAEPILYGGAVLTALGGSLWLCYPF